MYKKCEEILKGLENQRKIKIANYEFPKKQELKLRLKDMLEDEVDEKYYLSEKMINFFKSNEQKQIEKGNGFRFNVTDGNVVAKTITTRAGGRMDDNFIQEIGKIETWHQRGGVYSDNGISPTICATDYKTPKLINESTSKILIKNATKQGYIEAYDGDSVNLAYPNSNTRRGRVGDQVSQTLQCNDSMGVVVNQPRVIGGIGEKKSNNGTQWYQQDRIYDNNIGLSLSTTAQPYYPDKQLRIRKLTPKECWRLMGFDDEDFEKAEKVNSNAQLYKQAGNSIVVNVL